MEPKDEKEIAPEITEYQDKDTETQGGDPKRSPKEIMFMRMKEKYPDLDDSDEDGLFDKIRYDYDGYESELKRGREADEKLSSMLSADPRTAAFLMSWQSGENPVIQLIRMYGDEFKNAMDDPELQEKLAAAHEEYLSRQIKEAQLKKESEDNLEQTLNYLESAQKELNASDEEVGEAYKFFEQIVDDAIVNKVSADTWKLIFKAIRHDEDVKDALTEGEVKGRNTRIADLKKKTTVPADVPPALAGGGAVTEKEAPSLGAFDSYTDTNDIFQRGGMRRVKRN